MQIAHNQPVPQPNIQIFEAMKAGIDITTALPNASMLEYYYYIEAFKKVDMASFICDYCKLHKGNEFGRNNPNISKFLSVLYAIDDNNYNQQNDYIGLDAYVELAKRVFNEDQEPSSSNWATTIRP